MDNVPVSPYPKLPFNQQCLLQEVLSREFKIWRRQRQRQRHKSMIWLVGWMRRSNRAARVAHFLVQYFHDVCQTKTWNLHSWGSDANSSPQQKIFHCMPLHENHLSQVRETTLRLVCTTWQTWNNRITLNLTQITFYFKMTFSLQQLS